MKIGIDARFYGSLGKGLGRYASELIAQLEKLDRKNEYIVFLRRGNWDQYEPKSPNFRKVLAEYGWYGWREQLLYPFFLRRFRLDLMHFTHFNVPLPYRRPFVVTIHDLILLQFPTPRASTLGPLLFKLKYLAYRLVIGNALRRAKGILTVSKTSRDEIIRAFPFAARKQIIVTYGACASRFRGTETGAAGQNEPAAEQESPYMLYVGNAYPHKNLERLLAAFRLFREQGHPNWKLVLIGARDYFYGRLESEAARKDLDAGVVFRGHVNDEELRTAYRQAQFYVFPSLCEGFGLPPLEAMCNGLPVASSDRSCLPEVLDDAALFFNPEDTRDIASAMTRLADDAALRAELKARGLRHTTKYDWKTSAEKTLELYERFSHERTRA